MDAFSLTAQEIRQLREAHRKASHKRYAYRINAVILLGSGWSAVAVSEALLLDPDTLRRYVSLYRAGGVDKLLKMDYRGSLPQLNAEQQTQLDAHLQDNIYLSVAKIIAYVQQTFNVYYSLTGLTGLLHRMGFAYKKPKIVPGKADAQAQRAFVKEYEKLKKNKGKHDPIYFMDAVHPQHNTALGYGWIKRGEDKYIKSNTGRRRVNINGAINIETMHTVTRCDETINSESTIALFKQIVRKHRKAETIYIICDNARYYYSNLVRAFTAASKIVLIFLPPYSPNLNLIERYWKFFKKKVLNNCYYETFEEFKKACKIFFRKRKKYLPELKTLLAENFHVQTA